MAFILSCSLKQGITAETENFIEVALLWQWLRYEYFDLQGSRISPYIRFSKPVSKGWAKFNMSE